MWAIAAEVQLFRWHVSLDYDDMLALLAALGALLGVILIRRSQSNVVEQTIDEGVLGRFEKYIEEVTSLRVEIKEARDEIAELKTEVRQREKDEEHLRGELHERNKTIEQLKARVRHLEDVIRRAGLDGEL